MFKDYYLILGVSSDAVPEEIEKAFKEVSEKGPIKVTSTKDLQEAYEILSNEDTKLMYDEELANYNRSANWGNYEIKNKQLANKIRQLQNDKELNNRVSPQYVKGCLWTLVLIIIFMLSTCFKMVMKQRNHKTIRNSYTYVIHQTSI